MHDHVWLVLGLLGFTVLMAVVSSGLSHAVAAPGEAAIAARLEATRVANPSWPWELIDAGTLEVGMSEEMVLAALGTPDSTRETADASGRNIEWIYTRGKYASVWTQRRDGIDHRYQHPYNLVDFENGTVTDWSR